MFIVVAIRRANRDEEVVLIDVAGSHVCATIPQPSMHDDKLPFRS